MLKRFGSISFIEKTCLVAGLLLTMWYGWIVDDAYIYFRYVDNFVIHKIGLVYNKGEFVEGFSSPLWIGILIILRFLRLNYWLIIRIVGLISYTFFWYLSIKINRQLSHDKEPALNMPLVYLTCTYAVMCYFTSGLEAPLIIVLAGAYAALLLFPGNAWLHISVGLSPLVRHELFIPYCIALLWVWGRKKRFPLLLFLTCAIGAGSYELFRIWYYADLLPNPFYLKDVIWVAQGLAYLYDTCLTYQTIPFIGLFVLLYLALRKRHGPAYVFEEERVMMLIFALPVLCYVIKIGGDPRHFRYLAFPFCLCILSASGIAEIALQPMARAYHRFINAAVIFVALLFLSNFPRQLQQHPIFLEFGEPSHRTFLKINDAAHHRPRSRADPPAKVFLSYSAAIARYQQQKEDIAAEGQCRSAYLHPRSLVIHRLGLTDPFLARTVMKSDRPAHKFGLIPLTNDIVALRKKYGFRRNAFSDVIAEEAAPKWVLHNIASLTLIEAKAYNEHSFLENMKIAFKRVQSIRP